MGIRSIEVLTQTVYHSLRNQFQKQRGEQDLVEWLIGTPEVLQVTSLYDCFMADYATEILTPLGCRVVPDPYNWTLCEISEM